MSTTSGASFELEHALWRRSSALVPAGPPPSMVGNLPVGLGYRVALRPRKML